MLAFMRFFSLLLIALALMFLGADVVTSFEKGGQITVRSIEQVWSLFDKSGLDSFKSWLEHTLPGPVASWIEALLRIWTWAFLGVWGVIFAFLFGRRSHEA